MIATLRLITLFVMLTALSACATHAPYRTVTGAGPEDCTPTGDERITPTDCHKRTPEHSRNYDLYFVEFDDQGWLHPDDEAGSGNAGHQLDFLMEELRAKAAHQQRISLVVYVHGWKHNTAADDANVRNFRDTLLAASLVDETQQTAPRHRGPPRDRCLCCMARTTDDYQ